MIRVLPAVDEHSADELIGPRARLLVRWTSTLRLLVQWRQRPGRRSVPMTRTSYAADGSDGARGGPAVSAPAGGTSGWPAAWKTRTAKEPRTSRPVSVSSDGASPSRGSREITARAPSKSRIASPRGASTVAGTPDVAADVADDVEAGRAGGDGAAEGGGCTPAGDAGSGGGKADGDDVPAPPALAALRRGP